MLALITDGNLFYIIRYIFLYYCKGSNFFVYEHVCSNSITISLWVSKGNHISKLQGTTRDKQQYASRFAALGINDYMCMTIISATLTSKRVQLMLLLSCTRTPSGCPMGLLWLATLR